MKAMKVKEGTKEEREEEEHWDPPRTPVVPRPSGLPQEIPVTPPVTVNKISSQKSGKKRDTVVTRWVEHRTRCLMTGYHHKTGWNFPKEGKQRKKTLMKKKKERRL